MSRNEDELLGIVAQLRSELDTLKARVAELELQTERALAAVPVGPSEDEMLAISAAVAAYLGVQVRIQQVHLVRSSAWAQVGRIGVHASHRFN